MKMEKFSEKSRDPYTLFSKFITESRTQRTVGPKFFYAEKALDSQSN